MDIVKLCAHGYLKEECQLCPGYSWRSSRARLRRQMKIHPSKGKNKMAHTTNEYGRQEYMPEENKKMHNCEEEIIRQFMSYDWKQDLYICKCGNAYRKKVTMSTTNNNVIDKVELIELYFTVEEQTMDGE